MLDVERLAGDHVDAHVLVDLAALTHAYGRQTFAMKPETKGRDEAIARFKRTGGQPGKGATLIGRWTAVDFSGGFVLMESNEPEALTAFSLQWSDVMELRLVPVIEDAGLGEVLARIGR